MSTPTPNPTSGNNHHHPSGDHGGGGPLMSQRAAVILLLAVLCGVGAVLLLIWAGQHPGLAIVSGSVGAAGAAVFFNAVIGR